VGDPARVQAIDASADSVDVCRQRLPGVEAQVGYAEELPYGDGEFDLSLAQLVVGLLADAPKAVREMERVTRSAGRVGTCVWDFGGGMTVLRTFWDAAAEVSPGLAREYDQSLTHPYSTAPELGALWRAAGLVEVTTGELIAEASYEDFEDLWQPMAVPDGAPGRFLDRLSTSQRAVVKRVLHQRLGSPHSSFVLQARAWYVLGAA
jgi:SAM-dependent methyltransferase